MLTLLETPSTFTPLVVKMPPMSQPALPTDAELVARFVWQDESALSELSTTVTRGHCLAWRCAFLAAVNAPKKSFKTPS
jgi:hypothetical protein